VVTPAELRRRAAESRAEATGLAADADRLRGQAASLRGLLDPLLPMSQRVWMGPAAEEFEADVRRHGAEIDGQAARLSSVADELDRRAQVTRSAATCLDSEAAVAEAAEAAAAAAGTGVSVSGAF
jgi:uncharacterized protein YukE